MGCETQLAAYKPSKLGHTGQFLSEFISRSVHAELQGSVHSFYTIRATLVNTQIRRQTRF